jgi:hypothetical protein
MPEAAARPAPAAGSIVPLLLAVLLIPAVLGSSKTIFDDGDVSWHLATGQWILDHRAIPHTDPFSLTWLGKPWVPIEWLSEVFYALVYRLHGYSAVAALVTLCLIALHACVYFNANRWTKFALLPIIAMDFVLIPMMSARPHLLTWPILAFWTSLMLEARRQDRAPPLIAALLMAFWANLHGGFVFGILIAGAFGLEALVCSPDKVRALPQWLMFGLLCIAALFINGNGVEGVFHPLRFTQLQMLPMIDEWKPSNPAVTPFFFGVLAGVLLLIAWKRPRLPWPRWLLLGGLLVMALLQVRHQSVLAIVAAMILPEGFGREGDKGISEPRPALLMLAGGALLLVIARLVMPLQPSDNEANPWKLIAKVPAELRAQPVLNAYSMGGPLILSGIRPYVDGRGDMYGDELVVDFAHISHGDAKAFNDAVKRWKIRWIIFPNRSKALIALVAHTPEWRLVARDNVGVVYAKVG